MRPPGRGVDPAPRIRIGIDEQLQAGRVRGAAHAHGGHGREIAAGAVAAHDHRPCPGVAAQASAATMSSIAAGKGNSGASR